MTEPKAWEPQDPENLRAAVMQAMGSASMAWDPIPEGVFDSHRAKAVGDGLITWLNEHYTITAIPDDTNGCGCWTCVNKRAEKIDDFTQRLVYRSRMIVCPDCGNKRCPRATWHENVCSGSNDPEQPGSRYGGLE